MKKEMNTKGIKVLGIGLILLSFNFSWAEGVEKKKRESTPKSLYQIRSRVALLKKDAFVQRLRDFIKASRPSRFIGTKGHEGAENFLLKTIRQEDSHFKKNLFIQEFAPDIDYAVSLYENDFKREIVPHYKKSNPLYKKWDLFTQKTVKALKKRRNIRGRNIIWKKEGTRFPNEILVVGAHYDTIAHDPVTSLLKENTPQPGADNNASGVLLALSLIQLLSQMDIERTVYVVFFDWEELGFLGSRAFVQKYLPEFRKKKFLGLVNLEMLGHDSKVMDKDRKYGNMKAYIRRLPKKEVEEKEGRKDEGIREEHILGKRLISLGKKMGSSVRFELLANDFKNSANISFWQASLAAVTFSQNWEKDFNKKGYHSENDFIETLNLKTLYRSYQFIVGAIIGRVYDM